TFNPEGKAICQVLSALAVRTYVVGVVSPVCGIERMFHLPVKSASVTGGGGAGVAAAAAALSAAALSSFAHASSSTAAATAMKRDSFMGSSAGPREVVGTVRIPTPESMSMTPAG